MSHVINITVIVDTDLSGKQLPPVAVTLDHRDFNISPLPRDRELPWAPDSRERAARLIDHRKYMAQKIADALAGKLTEAILDVLKSQDPVNGYDQDEWRK